MALPFLVKLSQVVNEAVVIAFVDESGKAYSETIHGETRSYRVALDEGSAMPLYCTCMGKIILANISFEALQTYFNNAHPVRHTPNTIIEVHEMDKHLVKVRQEGIAFDNQEFDLGISGVAVKLAVNNKLLGAIAVVAPVVRLNAPKMQELIPLIKDCAVSIAREYGHRD
jgi:DNA-binding IclR family transcriptional regulator